MMVIAVPVRYSTLIFFAQSTTPFSDSQLATNNMFPTTRTAPITELQHAIADAARREGVDPSAWAEQGEELLKFSELLPSDLLTRTIIARLTDFCGARAILDSPISVC